MAKKSTSATGWLQTNAVRMTRVHFLFAFVFLVSVVIFDSGNLYTHKATMELWTAGGILMTFYILIWFLGRLKVSNYWYYAILVMLLILADIAFASYLVWWERGLYSKAVALYTVPIIAAASLRSRSILLATAALSAVTYSTISVRYFFQNYGLGYRIELWGTVAFYSAMFFVLALMLMVVIKPTEEKF